MIINLLFLKQINHMTLAMNLNSPKISAAGFFNVGYNMIPMVNLSIIG